MVKFEWSTFWIVLVSCFGVMIFSYLIDPYFLPSQGFGVFPFCGAFWRFWSRTKT